VTGRGAKNKTHIHQTETRHRILHPTHHIKRARRAPRIHKELVHVLESVELVGTPVAQDVDVEPVRLGEQEVGLAGDEGEALEEADAEGAVGDDLGDGEGGGLDVVAALDDLEVGGDGAEVFVGWLVGQVAEAEGLAYLAGGEELLELRRGDRLVSLEGRACWGDLERLGARIP
jgi:hypothetical protein